MQDHYQSPYGSHPPPPPRRGSSVLLWVLGGAVGLIVLVCGGCLASLMYVGVTAPETSVYPGNRVPERYMQVMKDVGALDAGETILFFYSDGFTDIRDGFYFVSDKNVVIYIQQMAQPLTKIPLNEIEDVELYRDESFFGDSEITIYDADGDIHFFPVSSEFDRDEKFFEAIKSRADIP